jgi:hypothetical protein
LILHPDFMVELLPRKPEFARTPCSQEPNTGT